MRPDRLAILDWSAAGRPRRGRDSIWLGFADGHAENPPTRAEAFETLARLVEDTLTRGETLLLGADFPFGYPVGLALALTGRAGAPALWAWLADHIEDGRDNASNHLDLAAAINARLPGAGPFWFNPLRREIPGLTRRRPPPATLPFAEFRRADREATGAQSVWKLGGAGAVGAQALTGIAVLERLRRTFPGRVAVWPFEPLGAPVTLAEVFPSLLAPEVRARLHPGGVKDRVQVTLLARALHAQPSLEPLLRTPQDPAIADEGWILGLGHLGALRAAL